MVEAKQSESASVRIADPFVPRTQLETICDKLRHLGNGEVEISDDHNYYESIDELAKRNGFRVQKLELRASQRSDEGPRAEDDRVWMTIDADSAVVHGIGPEGKALVHEIAEIVRSKTPSRPFRWVQRYGPSILIGLTTGAFLFLGYHHGIPMWIPTLVGFVMLFGFAVLTFPKPARQAAKSGPWLREPLDEDEARTRFRDRLFFTVGGWALGVTSTLLFQLLL